VAKKQDEVKKAIGGIVLGNDQEPDQDQSTDSGYRTITVGLTADQLADVEAIADELGQARHAILKYAVIDFVRRYKAGERPEFETVKVLKID
jgi:hypothetical protein